MNVDAAIAQPAPYPSLLALGVASSTGQVSCPFREADAAGLNQRKHHPAAGRQMAQMRPGAVLTQPYFQGIVKTGVLLHSVPMILSDI